MDCEGIVRKSPRLKGLDYASKQYYFITVCTNEHRCEFDRVMSTEDNGEMCLNDAGELLKRHINALNERYSFANDDKFIIMPNHIHMILALEKENCVSVPQIIGLFKSGVSREMGRSVWQRSFHDHIIRSETDYKNIWNYIDTNPAKWVMDKYYNIN